eukprot:gene12646-17049_t
MRQISLVCSETHSPSSNQEGANMVFPNAQASTYNDQVVRQFAIMTVVWGVVGMLVGVLIASQLNFWRLNFNLPWLTFGRLRP